jgi:hypothetical protein
VTSLEAGHEIRWFFRDAAGDMGLASNFGGMVAALEGGGFCPAPSYEISSSRLRAATEAREIRKALDTLAERDIAARVLVGVAFRGEGADERHALIAAMTLAAEEHRRSRSRRPLPEWLEKQRTSKEQVRRRKFLQLRDHAKAKLDEALEAYARCRCAKDQDPAEG